MARLKGWQRSDGVEFKGTSDRIARDIHLLQVSGIEDDMNPKADGPAESRVKWN